MSIFDRTEIKNNKITQKFLREHGFIKSPWGAPDKHYHRTVLRTLRQRPLSTRALVATREKSSYWLPEHMFWEKFMEVYTPHDGCLVDVHLYYFPNTFTGKTFFNRCAYSYSGQYFSLFYSNTVAKKTYKHIFDHVFVPKGVLVLETAGIEDTIDFFEVYDSEMNFNIIMNQIKDKIESTFKIKIDHWW